jgi:Tol biopolymer transport system component
MKKLKFLMVLCTTILILNPLLITKGVEGTTEKPNLTIFEESNITDYIWSSDGKRIAYITVPEGQSGYGELWIAFKHPNQARLLHKHLIYSGADCDSLFDYQGKWILFMIQNQDGTPSNYYGRNELWKIRFNGDNLTQITFTNTNGIRTTWSNSGNQSVEVNMLLLEGCHLQVTNSYGDMQHIGITLQRSWLVMLTELKE